MSHPLPLPNHPPTLPTPLPHPCPPTHPPQFPSLLPLTHPPNPPLCPSTPVLPCPQVEGSVDMRKLNTWLSKLLQERGADLFRSKGIVSVDGSNDK